MAAKELFSLGKLYPSDFLKPDEQPRCEPVELKLVMEDNGLVHLEKTAPPECMYGERYWYRSGINTSMRNELKDIVDSITKIFKLNPGDVWCDIASNDGTLLSFTPAEVVRIGIDPADDSYKNECNKHADLVIQDFFSAKVYRESLCGKLKSKVITSIAMFYDLENPEEFIKDVYDVLDDDGLWVLQLSYSPLMLKQTAFDNIVHEHILYLSLSTLNDLFNENGFKILDCQLNDVNGGSFRVYAMKEKADTSKFGSEPYRDVCLFRTKSLILYEHGVSTYSLSKWQSFFENIKKLKSDVVNFIKFKKKEGKTIMGYGASTKGNTLLQYFELDNSLITAIADRSEYKWGLRTVGTNIPIISEEEMRKAKPDYLLILPWHFINEFKERESEYLKGGGKFIVPCPKFEIVGI